MASFTYTFIGLTPEEINGVSLEPGEEVTYPTEVDHPRLLPQTGAVPVLDNTVIDILNALHGTSIVAPTADAPVGTPTTAPSTAPVVTPVAASATSTNSTPDTTTSTDATTTDASTTDTTTESN